MNSIGASQSLQAWTRAFNRSASTVTRSTGGLANDQTNPSPAPCDDLIDDMVGMQADAIGVHAPIQVIRTQDQMLGSIIDMLA